MHAKSKKEEIGSSQKWS